jgi:hypothetical protein
MNKQILFFLFFIFIFHLSNSQVSIEIYDENDVVISNTTKHLIPETHNRFKIHNTGGSSINVILEISSISLPSYSGVNPFGIQICTSNCYEPVTSTGQIGTVIPIAAGSIYDENSYAIYLADGETGAANFELTFKEEGNVANSVSVLYDSEYSTTEQLNEISRVSVFPNPAHDKFSLIIENQFLGSFFFMTDILGKTIINQEITQNNTVFSTDRIKNGIYFFSIIKTNEIIETKKIAIKK